MSDSRERRGQALGLVVDLPTSRPRHLTVLEPRLGTTYCAGPVAESG